MNRSSTQGLAWVYHEPMHGWSGTVRPAATLTAGKGVFFDLLATSGRSVFAATNGTSDRHGRASIYAFSEPRHGWSGVRRSVARLTYRDGQASAIGAVVASASRVGVSWARQTPDICPCQTTVNIFSKPRHGWIGTVPARWHRNVSSPIGATDLAIQGQTLFAADGTQAEILR